MRVISGIYKRRRFDVPHSFKARPTTDNPKGTTYVWSKYNHKTNRSMTGRVEFDYEAERKTIETTYAEIVDEGVQNIFERYENDNAGNEGMVGLDMSYKGTYK